MKPVKLFIWILGIVFVGSIAALVFIDTLDMASCEYSEKEEEQLRNKAVSIIEAEEPVSDTELYERLNLSSGRFFYTCEQDIIAESSEVLTYSEKDTNYWEIR